LTDLKIANVKPKPLRKINNGDVRARGGEKLFGVSRHYGEWMGEARFSRISSFVRSHSQLVTPRVDILKFQNHLLKHIYTYLK
jgi:hypothetical protein